VRGTSTSGGRIGLSLRKLPLRRGERAVTFGPRVPAGAFNVVVTLPRTLLPGRYRLSVAGIAATRTVVIAAPPEGVASRAFAAARQNGPPSLRLPGRRTILWGYFRLAALPRRGVLTTTWIRPDGRPQSGAVRKPRTALISTFVEDRSGIRPGTWRCVLRAGRVVVARLSVRIG
jgi:hypothetical protein